MTSVLRNRSMDVLIRIIIFTHLRQQREHSETSLPHNAAITHTYFTRTYGVAFDSDFSRDEVSTNSDVVGQVTNPPVVIGYFTPAMMYIRRKHIELHTGQGLEELQKTGPRRKRV